MEITCKKCRTRLTVPNPATPIFKCTSCGFPNPVMASSAQSKSAPDKDYPVHHDLSPESKEATGANPGWLVVHDEQAERQTYPLRLGKQVIGRKSNSRPCDIMIQTNDSYMGRNHCLIEVKPSRNGGYDFFISDMKMTNGVPESMSTNGTFINAQPSPLKPNDLAYLNDGDTIQMGKTKVVIKTVKAVTSAQEASRIVQASEYSPTVIIQ